MANYKEYKEYRSVSEFPLHPQTLDREKLETAYHELRREYRSLSISRGQLVRRQTEAKKDLVTLRQNLQQSRSSLEKLNQEKQELQRLLLDNVEIRKQLEKWGNDLEIQVNNLTHQINATNKLLGEFESVYEEVKGDNDPFRIIHRFQLLIQAAHRLLNTDISTLFPHKLQKIDCEDWTQETPSNIGRKLLDK
jgi:chromosome segregation ATPase